MELTLLTVITEWLSILYMSFKTNKYTVLKNAISPELAEFVYQYFLNKRNVARFLFDRNTYLHLQNIMVYGMMNKCLTPIHIIVIWQWKLYYSKLNL